LIFANKGSLNFVNSIKETFRNFELTLPEFVKEFTCVPRLAQDLYSIKFYPIIIRKLMLKSHSAPFNCKRNLFDKQKHYPKKFADAQC